ncbi:MAG: TolC family outer membrane protein [Caulobacteraceae bacterium]|nr:TolC family outer membrane protein [Caulobacter sp.]
MPTRRAAALRLTASALALAAAALPARGETLAEAIALAYAHNPTLQAQRASLRATDETYAQTRAGLGPTLSVGINGTYQEARGSYYNNTQTGQALGITGHQENRTSSGNVSLTQTLYTGGRTRAALNAAEANILSARQDLRATEITIVQQVISAYTAVRRDAQVLAAYRDNLSALQRQLEQTNAEFGVRQVTRTDVDITLGRVALAQNSVAQAQAQLEISRAQYLNAVGQNPGELAPEPVLESLPPSLDAAFDATEAHNTQLLAAQFAEQSAGFRVAEAKRQYLPTIQAQLSGTIGPVTPYAQSGLLANQTRVVTGVISLNQPLYTSGLYASQTRQAIAQQEQAREQTEATRRTAVQNTSVAWSQLIAARTQLAADTSAVDATTRAFYGVRREQPFGLRLPIDVLNAEQELNSAQIRLLQDRYNEYAAQVSMLADTGLLEAALLVPDLDVIDPTTHFRRVRDIGQTPWEPLVRAADGIGVHGLRDPAPPRQDDRSDRPRDERPLPPAPPPAAELKPFVSATEIIAREKAGAPPPTSPSAVAEAQPAAPTPAPGAGSGAGPDLSRCELRQAQLGLCAAGGAPPAATQNPDAPVATQH